MRTIFLLLLVLISTISCTSENHYHDGYYEGGISFMNVSWEINGNEILINNSVTGESKVYCRQYPDRIEYEEDNGTTRILYAQENGDLKLSDLIIFKKVSNDDGGSSLQRESNENIGSRNNQMYNFNLSKDSYTDESAIIKEIKVVENEVYIVVDVVQIEYPDYNDDEDSAPNYSYKIVNENSKLRTYKVISNIVIQDRQCLESKTLKYIVDNKERIKTISPAGFALITTNNKGELINLNLGCWN